MQLKISKTPISVDLVEDDEDDQLNFLSDDDNDVDNIDVESGRSDSSANASIFQNLDSPNPNNFIDQVLDLLIGRIRLLTHVLLPCILLSLLKMGYNEFQ